MKKTPTATIPLAIRESLEYISLEGQGRLLGAILNYVYDGSTPDALGEERLVFWTVKSFLDEEREHKKQVSEARSTAGKKGGRPAQKEQKPQKAKKAIASEKKQLLSKKPIAFEEEKDWEILDPSKKVVVQLILKDGTYYDVTQEYIDRQKELYNTVNVLAEIKAAVAWSEANPSRRKTRTGAAKYLNSWLNRAQERGGASGLATPSTKAYYNPMFEYAEQLKRMEENG